jgi:Homeodomain-like domain
MSQDAEREGLSMLKITNPTVTREQVWSAFRPTPDGRLRERYHGMVLWLDGESGAEIAHWLYRDEETIRSWVHAVNEAGLPGLAREPIPGRPT